MLFSDAKCKIIHISFPDPEIAYLDILGELIVAEYVHGRELPHVVELELDLERMAGPGVVPPPDPSLTPVVIVVAHLEVVGPDLAVRQLSKSAQKLAVPVTVVRGVEELPVAAFVALGHRVRHDTVVPRATVQFHPHANGAPMVAVRPEADLARPHRWLQLVLRLQVRVLVPVDHLSHHTFLG